MSQIPGVHPVRSEATFYMLMNLSQLIGKTLYEVEIHDADDFASIFLKEDLVAVVPAQALGRPTMSVVLSPCPWRTSRRAWTGWRSSSKNLRFSVTEDCPRNLVCLGREPAPL